jgi:hypothetical protein
MVADEGSLVRSLCKHAVMCSLQLTAAAIRSCLVAPDNKWHPMNTQQDLTVTHMVADEGSLVRSLALT